MPELSTISPKRHRVLYLNHCACVQQGTVFNDYLSPSLILSVSGLHFSHSLVCWWLFGLGEQGESGARLWLQAEGLITVLAREQKAEGQEGWKGMRKGREKMEGPRALTKSSCGAGRG